MALLKQLVCVAGLGLAGCGVSGAEGGGTDHLPSAGAGPYAKATSNAMTPAEEPYVIVDATADLRDPSALAAAAGGFDLWFTHAPSAAGSEIWRAHVTSITEKPDVAPELALAPLEAWENGTVEAPSVVDLGDGRLVMYYQGGGDAAPAIGRATSDDGGRTWMHEGQVLLGGMDPSALIVDGHTFLYYGLPDGSGIALAEADAGGAFVISRNPVVRPSRTNSAAFDQAWVGEPDAVGGKTSANQLHIGLFYVGRSSNGTYAIGHAASSDGRAFLAFLGGAPVLEAEAPDERGPAAVLFPDHGELFFGQQRAARSVIAVATSP